MIPYGRQRIDESDLEAVRSALLSEFVTQGPRVASFESALAKAVRVNHVIAVNSATSALHLACLALGVGEGDLVWTSAISFVASANAARYCGADIDFVDIELASSNIAVAALREKLNRCDQEGQKKPKVLIAVHMAGQSADMSEIFELSKEHGFKVIEDASHALGATYKGSPVGSCEYSEITVFSFHAVKMITTGEGGACVTNSPAIAAKLQQLRSHGITRDPAEMSETYPGGWYYEQQELGFNYRITDFQAALGESQLSRLENFVQKRNEVAQWYWKNLNGMGLDVPSVKSDRTSSFHLFVVLLPNSSSRKATFESMRAQGILVNVHYLPIYRHPYYSRMGKYNPADFPMAEEYYSRCLSIPIFPDITEEELNSVRSALTTKIGFQNLF